MKKFFEFLFFALLALGAAVTITGAIDGNAGIVQMGYGFCAGSIVSLGINGWMVARKRNTQSRSYIRGK